MESYSRHLIIMATWFWGLPWSCEQVKSCLQCRRRGFDPWFEKIPGGREWQSTPVFFPGESYEKWSLVGCSPKGRKESDMTEHAHILFNMNFTLMPSYLLQLSHHVKYETSDEFIACWLNLRNCPSHLEKWSRGVVSIGKVGQVHRL